MHICMRPHPIKKGRARPSLSSSSCLIYKTLSMDPVGVHSLDPAATQGRQDASGEHANGSLFTGWGTDTQTSQDAPHHGSVHGHHLVTILHKLDSSSLVPVQQCPHGHSRIQAHIHCSTKLSGATRRACVCPTDHFMRGAYIHTVPAYMYNNAWRQHICRSALDTKPCALLRWRGGVVAPAFRHHTLLGVHHTVAVESAIRAAARRRAARASRDSAATHPVPAADGRDAASTGDDECSDDQAAAAPEADGTSQRQPRGASSGHRRRRSSSRRSSGRSTRGADVACANQTPVMTGSTTWQQRVQEQTRRCVSKRSISRRPQLQHALRSSRRVSKQASSRAAVTRSIKRRSALTFAAYPDPMTRTNKYGNTRGHDAAVPVVPWALSRFTFR